MTIDVLYFIQKKWSLILGALVAAALLVGLVMLVIAIEKDHQAWVSWCQGQGGSVISDTDTGVGVGTGIGSNGGTTTTVVVTSSTDYYCISESGGILDIR